MKSENIFGNTSRAAGEGNHRENARIEVPKVVKAIHKEGENSPVITVDEINLEVVPCQPI